MKELFYAMQALKWRNRIEYMHRHYQSGVQCLKNAKYYENLLKQLQDENSTFD